MSDANGKFALRGLSEGLTKLSARALGIKQKIDLPMALNAIRTISKSDCERYRCRPT